MNVTHHELTNINLDIGDQITLHSCGHVVVEIIKFIAYQRLQIPYTYPWLKQLVNSRLIQEIKKESYQSERHFYTASTALKNLDFILQSLLKEIGSVVLPEEVCVVLGPTPYTCKEIYRFLLPTLCHKPQCQSPQIATSQKLRRHVFKTLATSEELGKIFYTTIPPTNMYVFIKRKVTSPNSSMCSDDYVLVKGYKIPKNCKIVNVNFGGKTSFNAQCCNNFSIFSDIATNLDNLNLKDNIEDNFDEIESSDNVKWFQSTYILKGFKDCIVNGTSVTNTWAKS